MDSTYNTVTKTLSKVPIVSISWIVAIVVIVGLVSYVYLQYPTFAAAPRAQEGFFGGVVKGAGHPDCLRDLNAGAELLAAVSAPDALSSPDYAEFQVLLSKLGCLKKDLMSPSGIVEATRYQPYETAHAGLPLVQHSMPLMLHYVRQGKISLEKMVEKMSHAVAACFQIADRGYIREGYFADLVIADLTQPTTVTRENILYKCGWSPLEGFQFPATITHTFVNGHMVYGNGVFEESFMGKRLLFNR